jgi:hypothetical protein
LALGNANYCQGGNTSGWEIEFPNFCGGGGLQNPFWWAKLVQDPTFTNLMHCRWLELRQDKWHTDTLMAYIDSLAYYLDESQQRNFQKWPVLGTYLWPNNFVGNTYAEEIGYLKTWITNRADWMDANMFGSCTNLDVFQSQIGQYRVFPNPANSIVYIECPGLISEADLVLYDATGRFVLRNKIYNSFKIELNIKSLDAGIYHYKIIESNSKISTGKISVR